jgi:chromosomal replication initiator protein
MISRARLQRVARPRQVAMFVARRCTKISLPRLGQMLGGRDHGTVHAGIAKIRRLMTEDAALAATVLELIDQFGEGCHES